MYSTLPLSGAELWVIVDPDGHHLPWRFHFERQAADVADMLNLVVASRELPERAECGAVLK